jgi:hypothetical protein
MNMYVFTALQFIDITSRFRKFMNARGLVFDIRKRGDESQHRKKKINKQAIW